MTLRRTLPFYNRIQNQTVDNRFIFTINTANTSSGSSTSTQFKLPIDSVAGDQNFIVDWGDGNTDLITSYLDPEITHTYTSSGIYTVSISGECNNWRFANTGDRLKILDITNWGSGNVRFRNSTNSIFGTFYNCTNLNVTATDSLSFSASNVTQIAGFFRQCSSLVGNIGFDTWDLTGVTVTTNMFQSCPLFNAPIGNWDMSLVTAISVMLSGCTAFDQNIGSWNISNVIQATNFLGLKTPSTFSASNLDSIYNGWSSLPSLKSGVSISFGTAKYTAAGSAGRTILTGAPNNWTITDGGI